MLVKNLNNAYFRDNVENDDVKNTGFNGSSALLRSTAFFIHQLCG